MIASKKRMLFKYIMLVIFSLSLIITFSTNPAQTTSEIGISILNYDIGWCGGTTNDSRGITHWDVFASIFSFTLRVANFDTTSHTLDEITITKTGYHIANGSQFKLNESISTNGELPVTLLPLRYWSGNFTCESVPIKLHFS